MGRAFEVRKVAMGKTAAAKSKVYSRYGREILMAAKSGTPEPETNLALKQIIDKAKRDQVPTDIIKRAIERAKGGSDENYVAVRYEGFGVDGTMFANIAVTTRGLRVMHFPSLWGTHEAM
jgi:transcriptional/translational regulatory protein YebC/TACO1